MTLRDLLLRVVDVHCVLRARYVAISPTVLTVGIRRLGTVAWVDAVAAIREQVGPLVPDGMTLELVDLH